MGFAAIVATVRSTPIEDLKLIVYFRSFRSLWYFVLKLSILANVKRAVWKRHHCVRRKDALMFGPKINVDNCNKHRLGLTSSE